jgi:hypothetical protein
MPDGVYQQYNEQEIMQFPSNLVEGSANTFIGLTSYTMDTTIFRAGTSEANSAIRSNAKVTIALPIPTSGLNITDTHTFENVNGIGGWDEFAKSVAIRFGEDKLGKALDVMQAKEYLNTLKATAYRGPDFKKFQMKWDLIPSNKEDAKTLKDIINKIRERSLPFYRQNDIIVEFPDYWILDPVVKDKLLFSIDALMIERVNVSYDGEANTTFFYDGSPVKTTLEIDFTEVSISGRETLRNALLR